MDKTMSDFEYRVREKSFVCSMDDPILLKAVIKVGLECILDRIKKLFK